MNVKDTLNSEPHLVPVYKITDCSNNYPMMARLSGCEADKVPGLHFIALTGQQPFITRIYCVLFAAPIVCQSERNLCLSVVPRALSDVSPPRPSSSSPPCRGPTSWVWTSPRASPSPTWPPTPATLSIQTPALFPMTSRTPGCRWCTMITVSTSGMSGTSVR